MILVNLTSPSSSIPCVKTYEKCNCILLLLIKWNSSFVEPPRENRNWDFGKFRVERIKKNSELLERMKIIEKVKS